MKSKCVLLRVIGVFAKIYLPDDPRVLFEVQAEPNLGEKDNPLVGISA